MLLEWFDQDKKILMLGSLVICLSFTILNTFKNKKGISKILVIIVPFCIIVTSDQEQFVKGA